MFYNVKFSLCTLILSALFLVGCNGDDDKDLDSFLEFSDQRLSSLVLVEGGTLTFKGNEVEEFNPDVIGPYVVELDDQEVSSLTFAATPSLETSSLTVIEVGKDEDENGNDVSRFTDISSGVNFEADIEEGANNIYIRVRNEDTGANTFYLIQANRVSSSADLAAVQLTSLSSLVVLDEEFDADTTAYSAEIGATFCETEIEVVSQSTQASVTINGESPQVDSTINGTRILSSIFTMSEGENTIVVDVTSEDQTQTKQYQFTVTRSEASDTQVAADPRLKSMTFSEGRAGARFRCTGNEVSQFVTNAVTALALTVETEREGVTIALGNALLDENGLPEFEDFQWAAENEVELSSGVVYDGELLANLEVGVNYFVLTTTSTDTDNFSNFLIQITRSENNEVFVETAQELQNALKNATPNDDIVVFAGDYLGVVGEADSGSELAHFYSDVDGTADAPIKLRAGESGVRLLGDDLAQHSVLLLQGDYWQVSGFEISGAQNGIVLDGANHGQFGDLNVHSLGERGMSVINGSSENEITFVEFDKTGLFLQSRDGVTEIYDEAVVIGGGELPSEANTIRHAFFGRNMSEAVDIKANAPNTEVHFSTFSFDNTLNQAVENRSIVSIASDGNAFSYNQFNYDNISNGTDGIAQIINVSAAELANTDVFQNIFDLENQGLTALNNSGDGAVTTADNTREDSGDLIITGTIDDTHELPVYQIQSTLDASQCFARRDVTFFGATESSSLVVADDCADEDDQRWVFIHDSDNYVLIALASNPAIKLYGVNEASIGTREDSGAAFDDAFSLRWKVLEADGEVAFLNKAGQSLFIGESTEINFDEEELEFTPITLDDALVGSSRAFTLVQLN